MTCKEALAAHYRVLGKKGNGYSEYAACLSFHEAQRFYDSLISRGFTVTVWPF